MIALQKFKNKFNIIPFRYVICYLIFLFSSHLIYLKNTEFCFMLLVLITKYCIAG